MSAKRHPASWKAKDETYHPFIEAARAKGYETENLWQGIETLERALEVKRGIYNAARHLGESVHTEFLYPPDGTITVKFVLHSKATARKYIKDSGRWAGN